MQIEKNCSEQKLVTSEPDMQTDGQGHEWMDGRMDIQGHTHTHHLLCKQDRSADKVQETG